MKDYLKKIYKALVGQVDSFDIPMPDTNIWINGSHLHCKKCGEEAKFLTRLPWNVHCGVRAIGICKDCSLLIVQKEYGRTKYKKLRTWI